MLVWTPEAEAEAGRTIKSLLSTRELKLYIQRDRRRQDAAVRSSDGEEQATGEKTILTLVKDN